MSRDALVVGINTYQYLPSLKAPARDAEAIAQQLHTYGEFRVHRLPEVIQDGKPMVGQKTRVNLRELETALINLFKPKGSSVPQTAIFYFSGHGTQREAGIREGYLALSDSNPDQGFYGLSLFWLRRLLQESPVRQRIILLDCCHSGELLNFLEADPGAHPGTDRLFMAASREYETAYEALDSQYSVFTEALLTGLDPSRIPTGVVTNHSLTDWVNHSLKGEIQQPLFESSGSEIILTRQNGSSSKAPSLTSTSIQSTQICPYRGLEFFDESHAEYFFGREEITAQLLQKLSKEPFAAVVGASGSGKSSLVRAGLIAQLRQGKRIPGSDQWKIRLITPTEHPLKSLAAAFIEPDLSDLERAEQLRRAETFLQDGGAGLAQLVRASLPSQSSTSGLSPESRPRFLLVIDQFEEIFTLSQGSQAERERQEFFDCLIGALDSAKDWLSVVIVVRADFFNKCSLYEGLAQLILPHRITVTPLKYEQIKATIVRPAQKVGLVCEPNLVYTMLSDIIGAPGELPLLQYTLSELWRKRRVGTEGGVARLTLDAYQELGGVRGTLRKQATDAFNSLTEMEQTIAQRIFLALTQLGEGTEDTRRRVMKAELVSPAFPIPLVDQVLEKLAAAKLIIISQVGTDSKETPSESGIPTANRATAASTFAGSQEIVDVAHESLIRNWSLLRGWLDNSREILRRQRRIEQAAQEWKQAGQPAVGEYLLHGLRLRDAEDFLKLHPQELSALAHQYINVSYEECRRVRRKSKRIQVAVPSLLVATLTLLMSQYYGAIQSQAKKDAQLQQATARERTAIAQAVLQDTSVDPTAALLISRLAAEGENMSREVQATLRAALQNSRLQAEFQGHQGEIQQMVFSPNRQYLSTAGADGTIRLWAIQSGTIYNTKLAAEQELVWSNPGQSAQAQVKIQSIAFSANQQQIAAIAQDSPIVKVWAVESGKLVHQLVGTSAVKEISYSPKADWLATLNADHSISVWDTKTGSLEARVQSNQPINSLKFSPDGQLLLSAGEDGVAQIWQLSTPTTGALRLDRGKALTHPEVLTQASFSSSGRWVTTLSKDGKVRLWDQKTGKMQWLLSQPTSSQPTSSQPAKPQTANLTSTTHQKSQIQSAENGGINLPPIQQVRFSPDEQTVATIDSNHQVWLWHLQSGKLHTKLASKELPTHTIRSGSHSQVEALEFSPNGKLIATTSSPISTDGAYTVYLWDSKTGQQMGKLAGHQSPVTAIQFSLDGTYVVTASLDGKMRLWTAELGGELPSVQLPNDSVEWAAFRPSGSVQPGGIIQNTEPLALHSSNTASDTAETKPIISPLPKSLEQEAAVNLPVVQTVAYSAIQSVTGHQPWQRFNLQTPPTSAQNNPASDIPLAQKPPTELQIDGSLASIQTAVTNLVTVGAGGKLQQWQILTEKPAQVLTPEQGKPGSLTAAIRPQQLSEQSARLIALIQSQVQSRLPGALGENGAAQSLTTGFAQFVSAPFFASLAQFPPSVSLLEQSSTGNQAALSGFALSADGQLLATADIEGRVIVYQTQADRLVQLYQVQNSRFVEGRDSLISQVTQVTSQPGEAVNPLAKGEGQKTETGNTEMGNVVAIRHLSFSPDGQQLLGVADDLTIRSWNTQTGELMQVFRGHGATIRQARYSTDGEYIISASWDQTVRIWQASSGNLINTLRHADAVSSASFSPDGDRIVTTSWDGTAQIWQGNTGKSEFLLSGHQKSVLNAEFSPDGQQIVTASLDGTARLWNAATGEAQALLRSANPENSAILQAFFSPDGQYVATLTQGGKVHLWAATNSMLLKLARQRSLRQLTPDECTRYLGLPADQCPKLAS